MRILLPVVALLFTLGFTQEGSAISFRAHNFSRSGTVFNRSVLEIIAGESPSDSFNFWIGNAVSAQIRILKKWPAISKPRLEVSHRLGFTCNLYREVLAKADVSGPCGMPYQFEDIGESVLLAEQGKWFSVAAKPIQSSILHFKDFMYPTNAQIEFYLDGADSVEIEITDWKTDRISISSPTTTTDIARLKLWDTQASSHLQVVATDLPTTKVDLRHTIPGFTPGLTHFDLLGRKYPK